MRPYEERPVVFNCHGAELVGIAAIPKSTTLHATGVVVVVGGPQYRVGSHRQFTLLCRHLAAQGIASFRFDYHGSGDSDGLAALGVDGVEADLRAAIDAFLLTVPAVKGVVLWGLCGAASASALYAPGDGRVLGLAMLNPWVRTESGLAKARLRHYYLDRLGDAAFWGRIARGDVAVAASLRAFGSSVMKAAGWTRNTDATSAGVNAGSLEVPVAEAESLPARMLDSLLRCRLPVLVVLSGDADMTANEFRQLAGSTAAWRRWMGSADVQLHEVTGSNHTFARLDWRDEVAELTTAWIKAH